MDDLNGGYVNLYHVVSQVLMEGNMDDRWYEKILQLTINGYMELNFTDVITEVKTATLVVNNQNVAPLPKDYISYISIALETEGRIVPLTLNRNIALPNVESCGEYVRTTTTNTNQQFDDTVSTDAYLNGYGSTYTVGGGFNAAYYRIDEVNKQIVFLQHKVQGLTIILDYKGSGLTGANIIPRSCVPALRSYVQWRLVKNDQKSTGIDREEARQEWLRERTKQYARTHAFTMSEFLDLRYENTHRGLK